MKFLNYKCPICEKQFEEDDDIVVCPDCGTPHHRECYKENGKCSNWDNHGANQPIEVDFTDVKDDTNEEENTDFAEAEICENKGENTQQIVQDIFEEINNQNKDYCINNKHVSFYEAALKKNQKFYIPRFMLIDKTKKGVSWNVVAFFVPFAWSIYRKMYKIALIILALYVILFSLVGYTIFSDEEIMASYTECLQEDPYFYEDIILYKSNKSDVSLTEKQAKFNTLSESFELPLAIRIYSYVVIYGVRMLMGIYATNLYYKKLTKNIEKVDALELSPDMKRSVLYRKYGTFPFIIVAIIGFFELQMF